MNLKNLFLASLLAGTSAFAASAYMSQVGFLTNGSKQMVVNDAAGKKVDIKDADGKTVLSVDVPAAIKWAPANEEASLVDFSELKTAGTYQAYVGDEKVGHPIIVGDYALEELTKGSLKFFYFQRSSTALEEEYAGVYARNAGHPDTSVLYHSSTNFIGRPEDSARVADRVTLKAPKGWYDAGDYGKYIVNSGISTYTLLQLYQHNKDYFDTLTWNIPESKNDVPDILDEIRWNLEWMLAMQDYDGGVFHKLTTKNFAGMVLPEKTNGQRYVIGKGTEATLNFAAVMALAADIYTKFDKDFADTCAKAAKEAINWAFIHPREIYAQPSDIKTGSYTGASIWTIRVWALAELYRITKDDTYLDTLHTLKITANKASVPGWANSVMLFAYTVATNPDLFPESDVEVARKMILDLADGYVSSLEGNSYGVAMANGDFYWGSNSVAANKGVILLHAYILTKEQKYLDAATGLLDYLVGRNPLDFSYVTGYGVNSMMHPHHRPSEGDTVTAPIPGMLAGGPNGSAGKDGCSASPAVPGAPAKSYIDDDCSYSSNEIAINWNSPLAYLVGSLQAMAATGKVYDIKSKPTADYKDLQSLKKIAPQVEGVAPNRLVLRNGQIQVEMSKTNGDKRYFNLRGRSIK